MKHLKPLKFTPDQDEIKRKFSNVAHESYYNFKDKKHWIPLMPDDHIKALKNLKSDKTTQIIRPDKGKGVVILDRNDNIAKMETLLSDETKFTTLTTDPFRESHKLEEKIRRSLRTLVKKGFMTREQYDKIRPTGSSPALLYGLPKIHKQDIPLRPIMSSLNTCNRKLSKFMIPMLSHLSSNEYTIPNSFDFVNEITNFSYPQPLIMASFDIESLFTNIPLIETIDIIISQVFQDNDLYNGFNQKQFKELLMLSCTENIFLFNGTLYRQHEGGQMGGSMGPVLANIFTGCMENKWLQQFPPDFKPVLYRRYFDDAFLLFRSEDHIELFHNYMNSQHGNIKFTIEHELEGRLPFIGITISHNDLRFSTTVYHKSTETGLGMKFTSFNRSSFKSNSIMTLIHRCFAICSTWIARPP